MAEPILNAEQCKCLDDVLQSIEYTRQLISSCKNCGLDMAQYEQQLDTQKQIADGFKRNFNPNRP